MTTPLTPDDVERIRADADLRRRIAEAEKAGDIKESVALKSQWLGRIRAEEEGTVTAIAAPAEEEPARPPVGDADAGARPQDEVDVLDFKIHQAEAGGEWSLARQLKLAKYRQVQSDLRRRGHAV